MTSLKPCPFCGKVPNEGSYYQNQGYKYGGIQCCIQGPEVRTSYADWPAWKEAAIKAWNERANEANGKLAKAEATIKELIEALETIAGKRQCPDNLMGNVDIAHAVLKKAGAE